MSTCPNLATDVSFPDFFMEFLLWVISAGRVFWMKKNKVNQGILFIAGFFPNLSKFIGLGLPISIWRCVF